MISSSIFSGHFFSLFSFWSPYKMNISVFDVVPQVSYIVLVSSHFYFFSVQQPWFPLLCFPAHWFILLPHWGYYWFCSIVFISVIIFFNSVYSLYLLIHCWNFLFFSVWEFILLLSSLTVFMIITLNSFSGSLPLSPSFIWFCGLLPCSSICTVFLFHFIYLTLF